jgi:ribosomal protein L40E
MMKNKSVQQIICPKCEAPNPIDAINCRSCQVNFTLHYPEFFKRNQSDYTSSQKNPEVVMSSTYDEGTVYYPDRPGCVTAYAVLLWLGGSFLLLSALISFFDPVEGPFVSVFVGLFALVPIITGVGLWRMQKWGWWLVVVVQSLGVVAALFSLISGLLLNAIVTGVVSGGILYWFINNRQLFLGPFTHHAGVGSEGKPVVGGAPASKGSNTTIIVVGIVLAVFLVPVCIIATLTLLGPNIGDVFSRIVDGLAATPTP